MKMLVVAFFCAMVAVATSKPSGLIAPYAAVVDGGAVVKGPSSATTVVGPDGSSISSVADTGAVGVAPKSAIVPGIVPAAPAVAAPLYAPAPVAYASPAVYASAPALYASAPAVYASAPAVYASAPAVYASAPAVYASAPISTGTVIDGPSGRISTSGSAHGYISAPVAPGVVSVRAGW